MSSVLRRHVLRCFYQNVVVVSLSGFALLVGIDMAVQTPGRERAFDQAWRAAIESLPILGGPLVFLGAMITLGRFHAEGALLSLCAAGYRLRVLGVWILVAALPLASALWLFDVYPPFAPEPARPGEEGGPLPLVGGGVFVTPEGGSRRAPSAALLPSEGRVLIGHVPHSPRPRSSDQVLLRVSEEWDLEGGEETRRLPDNAYLWSGTLLRAPRSLVFGKEARLVALPELVAWARKEPERTDLWMACGVRLQGGIHVLVLLVLGFGFWLRPARSGFLVRSAGSFVAAVAYLSCEVLLAPFGAVGEIDPLLAAFGPAALTFSAGLIHWWNCERPGD